MYLKEFFLSKRVKYILSMFFINENIFNQKDYKNFLQLSITIFFNQILNYFQKKFFALRHC